MAITNKKAKKKLKSGDSTIPGLAEEILQTSDLDEVPMVLEDEKTYADIPDNKEPASPKPEPIILTEGFNKPTAFVIKARMDESQHILNRIFGSNNGDYFVVNEVVSTTYKNNVRERYKCIMVEDKNLFRYFIWFNISNLGYIY